MTEKRYFKRMWEDEFYIFDSQTISEKDFDEKVEYEDYQAFADSMTGEEVIDRLNKYNKEYLDCYNDVLKLEKENEQLKSKYSEQCIQLDFLKDENQHMRELVNENKQLKQLLDYADDLIQSYMSVHNRDEWESVKKNVTGDLE